ncbi:MAG: hypothetical protein IPK91_14605 [Saprospiraceae bacterium]|nr:hypothetical protein [Saprospiraceae bacterium]
MDKKDLILGKNALREAFAAEIRIQKIFISETLDKEDTKELLKLAHQHKVPILKVAKQKLDRLSRSNHQGVIGLNSAIPFYQSQSLVDNILFHGKNPALCVWTELQMFEILEQLLGQLKYLVCMGSSSLKKTVLQ